MKNLLGKEIYGIRSSKMQLYTRNGSVKEMIVDYRSEFRLVDVDNSNQAQLVCIESKWEELNNYSDNLEISFKDGGILSFQLAEMLKENGLLSKYYFSQDLESNSFFKIKEIEVYGYVKSFNNNNPTRHIVLFSSFDGEQILMYPMMSGVGLRVLVKKCYIKDFFSKSLNHELIYHAETFSINTA